MIRLLIVLSFGLAVFVVVAVSGGFGMLSTAMDAEETMQATDFTLRVVDQYIKENPGKWPQSWDELQATTLSDRGSLAWPRDVEKIRQRVNIDFAARLEDLAKQSSAEFKAIKPIGPHYAPYFTEQLLQTIRADVSRTSKMP